MKSEEGICESCKLEPECEDARVIVTEEGKTPIVVEECSEYEKKKK
jgi:hypothetical protein